MKKLFLDIETSPHTAYVWRLYQENVGPSQLIEPSRMLCVAHKTDGARMAFDAEWGEGGAGAMVRSVHAALDAADAVVHYNGQAFDEKHLNREFLQHGLTPPSPYATIDLYRVIKTKFKFASSKLVQVTRELEVGGGKLKTDFDLWRRVLAGEPAARREMERYCRKDTELLVDLYELLLPYIDRHPNAALYEGDDEPRCPRCASTDLRPNGSRRTMAGVFKQYRCRACGGYARAAKREATTPLREA